MLVRSIRLMLPLLVGCRCGDATPDDVQSKTAVPAGSSAIQSTEQLSPLSPGEVRLDGALRSVRWTDGDTFSWTDAQTGKRQRARLADYNALESYGPVHQWGGWRAAELLNVAERSTAFAGQRGWHCADTGQSGGYGRRLVRCPELTRQMLERGYGHLFTLQGAAPAKLVRLQKRAQAARAGMWAKGVPAGIVTSLHSVDERPRAKQSYDRVAHSSSGEAKPVLHQQHYRPCQWICREGSCMAYLPYEQRHGSKRKVCPEREALSD